MAPSVQYLIGIDYHEVRDECTYSSPDLEDELVRFSGPANIRIMPQNGRAFLARCCVATAAYSLTMLPWNEEMSLCFSIVCDYDF
jgi:hypothetical protein